MAGGIVSKLFGRSGSPPPEVEAALIQLSDLEKQQPDLASAAAFLRGLLPVLYEEPVREQPPSLTLEYAASKLAAGLPLLRVEPITLEAKAFQRRWRSLCTVAARQQPADAQALAEALLHGHLKAPELLSELLAGHTTSIYAQAAALGLNVGLTAAILRFTLFPVLNQFNQALLPLRKDSRYTQGYCPTCGSWPLLAEFRGLEQTRFLRCGLCAADWEFPRLRCPFCGTQDHAQLGFFHIEGEENRCRVATCEVCRGYVKIVSTLTALSAPELLVKDLLTLYLDLAAAERGYVVPQVT